MLQSNIQLFIMPVHCTYLQCARCLTVRSGVPRGYVCVLVPAAPGVRPPAAIRWNNTVQWLVVLPPKKLHFPPQYDGLNDQEYDDYNDDQ